MACGGRAFGRSSRPPWRRVGGQPRSAQGGGAVVVGGPARAGSARGWWQGGQAGEGGGQLVRPGPGGLEAEGGAAGVEGEASGGVQQPAAQRLGFADGELAVECQVLRPGGEVLGDQRQLKPDRVVVEVAEGEVLKPRCAWPRGCGPRRWRGRGAG